jgi:hypothetical protein
MGQIKGIDVNKCIRLSSLLRHASVSIASLHMGDELSLSFPKTLPELSGRVSSREDLWMIQGALPHLRRCLICLLSGGQLLARCRSCQGDGCPGGRRCSPARRVGAGRLRDDGRGPDRGSGLIRSTLTGSEVPVSVGIEAAGHFSPAVAGRRLVARRMEGSRPECHEPGRAAQGVAVS